MAETELEKQLQEEKEKVEQQVVEAGDKARQDAEDSGLSPDEVKREVEKARKEEKDKLYPTIEALKKDLKEIQSILKAERDDKEKIKKDTEKKAEEERRSKLSDQEKTQEVLNRLEEQLSDERSEREKFRQELEDARREDKLRSYREELIRAHESEIIPELVRGDSVEKLDESLVVAKARFKELEERFKQSRSENTRRQLGRTSTNPDYEALEEGELSKDLSNLDQDKYLKDEDYRKQIQGQLEYEYARLAGRR